MAPISSSILPIFFMILVVPINTEATPSDVDGGVSVWPIWNLKDPKVLSIANFALANHNNTKIDKSLHLVNVVDGSYSIIKDDGVERDYDIVSARNNGNAQPKIYTTSIIYRPRNEHPISVNRFEIFKTYLPGGVWPIHNLKDPMVVSAAKFAVAEYNKKANTTLNLVAIIKGTEQVVGGVLFHLVISAKDSRDAYPKEYEIVVHEQLWLKKDPLKLESFKKLSKSIFN